MKTQIPYHGWCFVCGNENPHGLGITMFVDDDGLLTSEFTLGQAQQGPPGHSHGGASAAILDEMMGLVVWAAGHKVLAANININYRKMLPLFQPLMAEAHITEVGARKILSVGRILLPDATVAVEGSGVYVVATKFFESSKLTGGRP
ncbi:MAG TPA: PaaI family thioesterase [Anaerolineales bacterium]|nr:PaaI family thioesterase [Anaerolineales bacterium]HNO31799.1 PaaI family thioesterase [Anaerolineales bacterium]